MSGLLRRLSSRFSRKKDKSATLLPDSGTASHETTNPRSHSMKVTQPPELSPNGTTSRRKIRPWASLSRMASNLMSPKRRKSLKHFRRRKSTTANVNNSMTIDVHDIDDARDTRPRSRTLRLRSRSSEQLCDVDVAPPAPSKAHAGNGSESPDVSAISARKRRWERRSRNRQLDSLVESFSESSEQDITDAVSPKAKRSPTDTSRLTLSYRSMVKSGNTSNCSAADTRCSETSSTANARSTSKYAASRCTNTTDSFLTNEDVCGGAASMGKPGTIKITYISCPHRGDQSSAADDSERTHHALTDLCSQHSNSVDDHILPNTIFHSPVPDLCDPEQFRSLKRETPSVRKASMNNAGDAISAQPSTSNISKPTDNSSASTATGTFISSCHGGNIGRTPFAKKTAISRFKNKFGPYAADDSGLSFQIEPADQNMSTLSKENTITYDSSHKKIRRTRSLDDFEHYERYYNFLRRRDSGNRDRQILDSFVSQLKMFHDTLSSSMLAYASEIPTNDTKCSLGLSHTANDSLELSKYCLSYMEGRYPDVFSADETAPGQADRESSWTDDSRCTNYDDTRSSSLFDTPSTIDELSDSTSTFVNVSIESTRNPKSSWTVELSPSPRSGNIRSPSEFDRSPTSISSLYTAKPYNSINTCRPYFAPVRSPSVVSHDLHELKGQHRCETLELESRLTPNTSIYHISRPVVDQNSFLSRSKYFPVL